MDVILLSIGTEILKGRILNTNSHYMASRLYAAGLNVSEIRAISDRQSQIIDTLKECFDKADIIISTGGLGPTRDDVTKSAACRFFNRQLVFDQKIYDRLEKLFLRIGYKSFPQRSRNQALVPEGAHMMPNPRGTAPGLLIEEGGKLLFLLPGVPTEMKALFDDHVLPVLLARFRQGKPESALVRTVGLGESLIAERIEEGLSEEEISLLNYYPHGGFVDILIAQTSAGDRIDSGTVDHAAEHVASLLSEYVYTREERSLLQVIAGMLTAGGKTLAVAESCTGGLLAKKITDLPGASDWFAAGVVSYSNESKTKFLGVPESLIASHGAVSEEVARFMAQGARTNCNADYALAITGIAGPTGGSKEKPVGTVYIAVASEESTEASRFNFNRDREQIRHRSVVKACEILWRRLKKECG
jgi:nicotinamide-nucleotide amidase